MRIKKVIGGRATIRLTQDESEFFASHPLLQVSDAIREALDRYIYTFNEKEYEEAVAGET